MVLIIDAFHILGLVDSNVDLEARFFSQLFATYNGKSLSIIAGLMSLVVRMRNDASFTLLSVQFLAPYTLVSNRGNSR